MCALNKVKGMDNYMEQNKIAKLIKQIRKDNNLTQKQFADKYNVTYQAVSKWENGINLPDMYLLKQINIQRKILLVAHVKELLMVL